MGVESLLVTQNPGIAFDPTWIDLAPQSASFTESDQQGVQPSSDDVRLLSSLLDLTSLNSDDTEATILDLFEDALDPVLDGKTTVAGACIFPEFLGLGGTWIRSRGIRLVTVAGSFPHGLGDLDGRCREVNTCAKLADEVDVPIDRRLVLEEKWEALLWETRELIRAAHDTPVKVILGTGELPNQQAMYRAATIAMMSGASFVKTSTGKERVNARLDAGAILCRAIKDYAKRTNFKVGLKPAGGIRSTGEATDWLQLVRAKLGDEWVSPELFRIGASGLLEHLRYSLAAP
jgi:deoxyribose-phosphate aldolase